jgi:NAD(P)H-dependent FMN reductase
MDSLENAKLAMESMPGLLRAALDWTVHALKETRVAPIMWA